MDRSTRQQIKHDKFVDEVNVLAGEVRRHSRRIAITIGAVVVVAIVAAAVLAWQARRERTAQEKLGEAVAIMNSPVGETATEGMPAPKYKTEAERTAAAEPALRSVVEQYGGTDAADVAELFLAQYAAARGDLAAARPKLQKFVKDHEGHLLAGGAQLSLYRIRMASEPLPGVIADVEKALNEKEPIVPKPALLALLAEAYEKNGEEAKARDTWRRITTEFPDSPYAYEAQTRIGQN